MCMRRATNPLRKASLQLRSDEQKRQARSGGCRRVPRARLGSSLTALASGVSRQMELQVARMRGALPDWPEERFILVRTQCGAVGLPCCGGCFPRREGRECLFAFLRVAPRHRPGTAMSPRPIRLLSTPASAASCGTTTAWASACGCAGTGPPTRPPSRRRGVTSGAPAALCSLLTYGWQS